MEWSDAYAPTMPSPSREPDTKSGKTAKTKDAELVELGQRVRALRQNAGLTQESLADQSDLHWSYVGQIERGERNLTYKNLLRLARGLGVSASELTPGSNRLR